MPAPPQEELGALLASAQKALDEGRWSAAVPFLETLLDRDPHNRPAREALVDSLMRLRRWTEAESQVRVLLVLFPRDPAAAFLAAAVAFRQGRFADAVTRATTAIELPGAPLEAYRIRALSRFMVQDYEGFKTDFETIIEKDPENADAYYNLGRYYYEKQLFQQAVPEFERAIEHDPGHFKAHYFLGWCQQARGDLTAAEQSYLEAIRIIERLHVPYGWPFSDLGELRITQGDLEGGLQWLQKGVENDPKLPFVHYMLGKGLLKGDAGAAAGESLRTAVRLDPGYVEAYYLLGRYYQVIGQMDQAREALATFQRLRDQPQFSPQGIRRTSRSAGRAP